MQKLRGSGGGLEEGDQERAGLRTGAGGGGHCDARHFAPENTEVECEDKL